MATSEKTEDEYCTSEDVDAAPANINSVLVNPFIGMRHEKMEELIESFINKTKIEDIYHEVIRKGAFLAQDGEAFRGPRTDSLRLKPDELEALRQEDPKTGNKWNQPWILYALVGCCSLGAAVQGWDETAVNGAQLFYQYAFGIRPVDGRDTEKNAWIRGLVNAAPYLCCAVLGCWLTEPLNRVLGRRGTIFVTCLISSATCVAQAFTSQWWHLFLARFCLGLGIGPKSATIPIYSAECVPANIRGGLVMMWQMWTAFGIMLGYIAGVIFRNVLQGDSSTCVKTASRETLLSLQCSLNWRLMLASPMLLPLIAAAYVFTLPESPRWLLLKARQGKTAYYEKAFRSLCRLRHSRLQAARDLFLMHHLLDGEEKIKQNRNRFVELWSVDRNRRALIASLTVMFLQQICGVNVMAFYSSEILSPVLGDKAGLLGSMGFGILNFLFALPAVYTIDTFGRRNLLLCTYPFLAFFQLLTAMGFLLPAKSPSHTGHSQTGLVLTGMYLFSVFYSPGQGPVPFVYSAESMPLYVRDLGMSMATATLWFFNFLLAVTFPSFQYSFGNTGAFGYYAAWCVVGWFMILFLVPETKNLTLEQLDARFSIPTRTHAGWAVKEVLFVVQYYLLGRKGAIRPVLSVPTENNAEMDMRRLPPRKLSIEIEQREIRDTEAWRG